MATQIQPFTRTPNRTRPATFSEDMDIRLEEENSRIQQMNQQSAENNALAQQVEQDALQVSIDKAQTIQAKDEAVGAKNDAVAAKQYIEGYVIPTEATYAPSTIDAKVRRAKVLTITNSI